MSELYRTTSLRKKRKPSPYEVAARSVAKSVVGAFERLGKMGREYEERENRKRSLYKDTGLKL